MNSDKKATKPYNQKSLRLWPGVTALILQWLIRFVIPIVIPGDTSVMIGIFGGLVGGLFILVWWAFFSRALLFDRLSAILLMVIALFITSQLIHESIATGGQGMMFPIVSVPILCLAFVIWAIASQNLSISLRRLWMFVTIFIASGSWILLRSDGITGDFHPDLKWRWTKTHEEKLMIRTDDLITHFLDSTEINTETKWPGFRGPNRDGIVHGVRIETDWKTHPPVELWRKAIGPGCSSFAVKGPIFYTQEQRGEDEIVSCYNLKNGELIWKHNDKARFWDSHAGAGPRSTPTIQDSLLYTLGATGILNVLKIDDGSVVWSRNAATNINDTIPGWGYASSPLVVDSVVIVAISGTIVAYDIATGEHLWTGPRGGENYSSPHLVTIDGIKQVLMMSQFAATSFAPANGKILWEHPWEGGAIIQPAMTENGDLLISEGYKKGIHRITVSKVNEEWNIKEHWMTTKIRPDFNDLVVHKGYIYGFEGLSLACLDLKDGSRKWKSGRYGGQILLLADQNLLLVLTEKGELILVEAVPDQFKEFAKIPAIKGKTWNHHVLVDDILLVRNTQEMVAFQLSMANW
ncbi:PQQ-binding-like beta-propeller repeat protein [Bacteroidota bacterium]